MRPVSGAAEGGLLIRVQRADEQDPIVSILSTRPLNMPQVFVGNRPEQLLTTLPLVYSVCGWAQSCAAVEAIEQAMGISPPAGVWQARRMLVWSETAREHLWRILLDWADFLGEPAEKKSIGQIAHLLQRFQQTLLPGKRRFSLDHQTDRIDFRQLASLIDESERLLQATVFSRTPGEWLQLRTEEDLSCWMEGEVSVAARMLRRVVQRQLAGLGEAEVRTLPELGQQDLNRRFVSPDAERFVAQPIWQGEVAETGPFGRQAGHPLLSSLAATYGNGLLPRLTARLIELATIPAWLAAGIQAIQQGHGEGGDESGELPAGVGIAQVEASRGRLVHRVVMGEGRISCYQILAPTEWNFHPQGVLAGGLAGLDADNEAEYRWRAGLLINTIDPCVGYDLEVV